MAQCSTTGKSCDSIVARGAAQAASDLDALHAIFVPVGGGGLIAGIAAYVKALKPGIKVIGVEPTGEAHRHAVVPPKQPFAEGVVIYGEPTSSAQQLYLPCLRTRAGMEQATIQRVRLAKCPAMEN